MAWERKTLLSLCTMRNAGLLLCIMCCYGRILAVLLLLQNIFLGNQLPFDLMMMTNGILAEWHFSFRISIRLQRLLYIYEHFFSLWNLHASFSVQKIYKAHERNGRRRKDEKNIIFFLFALSVCGILYIPTDF